MRDLQVHAHPTASDEWVSWLPLAEATWRAVAQTGRRWAYYGAADHIVRVQRWLRGGVLVRFEDGRTATVHPDDLHLSPAVPA